MKVTESYMQPEERASLLLVADVGRAKMQFLRSFRQYVEGQAFGVETGLNLRAMKKATGLSTNICRAFARDLTDEGFMAYSPSLFFEDGTTAGSGYMLTNAGIRVSG